MATIDEGAYCIQARLVADGSWAYAEGLARFDPDGRYFPITLSTEADGRWFAYVKHPAVPASMAVIRQVVGEGAGLAVLPLLGALGSAASRLGPRHRVEPSPCAAGVLVGRREPARCSTPTSPGRTRFRRPSRAPRLWAIVRIGRRGPSAARVAGLSAALSAGVLVRSESVLFAVAVLAVLAVVVVRTGRPRSVVAAVVPGAVLAVTMWCERRWVEAIVGGGAPRDLTMRGTTDGPGIVDGRIQGMWISAAAGHSPDLFAARGLILPVALVVVVVVVIRAARSEGHEVELALASLVATVLAVWAYWPTSLITGLVPASPLLVLGVAPRSVGATRSIRHLVLAAPRASPAPSLRRSTPTAVASSGAGASSRRCSSRRSGGGRARPGCADRRPPCGGSSHDRRRRWPPSAWSRD